MKKKHLKFYSHIPRKKINNKFQSMKGLISLLQDIEYLMLLLFYKRNIYKMIQKNNIKFRNFNKFRNQLELSKQIPLHLHNPDLRAT